MVSVPINSLFEQFVKLSEQSGFSLNKALKKNKNKQHIKKSKHFESTTRSFYQRGKNGKKVVESSKEKDKNIT